MAELNASARATVGKSHVDTSADIKVTAVVIGVAVIMAALVISWAAEGATPRKQYWQRMLTEREAPAQDFHDHLATTAELFFQPVSVPVTYPDRTAPGISRTMHQGFGTGGYQVSDPALKGGGPRAVPW